MKKVVVMMMALLVTLTSGYAQKKAVSTAKNKAMSTENPDYDGAREAIRGALENEETKDQANTWYVAGLIGYSEADHMVQMSYLGTPIDEAKKGAALVETFGCWQKALEMTYVPTLDKKGREVYDLKTRKAITDKLLSLYKGQDFVKYGIYANENKDYATAYDVFMIHLSIPQMKAMQEPKYQKEMPINADYKQYKYYAGLFASQSENHDAAISIFEEMKEDTVEAVTVSQFLYQEYVAIKDTAKFVETLQYAIGRFPQEPWFLQNLINHYIYSNQKEEAAEYLRQAIEREPEMVQYYTILARLMLDDKRYEEAAKLYTQAIELDSQNADAQAGMGYVYTEEADAMQNALPINLGETEYAAAMKDVLNLYRQAIPFFEKAHEIDSENIYYMRSVKNLYYRFISEPGMREKYDAIARELGM